MSRVIHLSSAIGKTFLLFWQQIRSLVNAASVVMPSM